VLRPEVRREHGRGEGEGAHEVGALDGQLLAARRAQAGAGEPQAGERHRADQQRPGKPPKGRTAGRTDPGRRSGLGQDQAGEAAPAPMQEPGGDPGGEQTEQRPGVSESERSRSHAAFPAMARSGRVWRISDSAMSMPRRQSSARGPSYRTLTTTSPSAYAGSARQ